MRKKILSIMSLAAVSSMMMASLTGCGTQAKATDQEVVIEEETILAAGEESGEADITEPSTAVSMEEETIKTEVVVADDGTEEADKEVSYTEHEYFFALDEIDTSVEEEVDMSALVPIQEKYELKNSATLYGSGRGFIIGYTKPNIIVELMSTSDDWYCINFADESPEYQLVLVKPDDFMAALGMGDDMPAITADDIKFSLMPQLGRMEHGADDGVYYVAVDDVIEEMASVAEFTIPTYCKDVDGWMAQVIADNDFENYQLFHIEKVVDKSDEENSCFKVTYGRLQKFVQ